MCASKSCESASRSNVLAATNIEGSSIKSVGGSKSVDSSPRMFSRGFVIGDIFVTGMKNTGSLEAQDALFGLPDGRLKNVALVRVANSDQRIV